MASANSKTTEASRRAAPAPDRQAALRLDQRRQDSFDRWIRARTQPAFGMSRWTAVRGLYRDYGDWADAVALPVDETLTEQQFEQALREPRREYRFEILKVRIPWEGEKMRLCVNRSLIASIQSVA